MALTGIGLLAYVLAHMIGNAKVFLGMNELGEYEIDLYGEALRNLGGDLLPHGSVLWLFRIGLIAAFAMHIGASAILTRRNWDARGWDRYDHQRNYAAANYASRTMRWGGTIILLFVLFLIELVIFFMALIFGRLLGYGATLRACFWLGFIVAVCYASLVFANVFIILFQKLIPGLKGYRRP